MDRKIVIILVTVIIVGLTGAVFGYFWGRANPADSGPVNKINSFEECADAGYPIMESYSSSAEGSGRTKPEKCRTPDGRVFTKKITEPINNEDDKTNDDESIFCTMDAKMCPDGSYVGRVPPNCEFAKCPNSDGGQDIPSPETSGSQGIQGIVLLGPTCPVASNPPDPQCADKPYSTGLVVTTADGRRTIMEFQSDEMGIFRVQLPTGDYKINSGANSSTFPRCATDTIKVISGAYTETTVNCDTGIR